MVSGLIRVSESSEFQTLYHGRSEFGSAKKQNNILQFVVVCRYRGSRRSKCWSSGKIIKNYNSMEYNTALHTSLRVLRL